MEITDSSSNNSRSWFETSIQGPKGLDEFRNGRFKFETGLGVVEIPLLRSKQGDQVSEWCFRVRKGLGQSRSNSLNFECGFWLIEMGKTALKMVDN